MAQNVISKEDVAKIASLSNLDVSKSEGKFSEMLSDTINYIAVLDELDTKDVKETYQVSGLTNVFQDPTLTSQTLTSKEALSNADETRDGLIATKAVFER